MKQNLEITLPALTISFGPQILRTLWPYQRYLLHDRFSVSPVQTGLIRLAILAIPAGYPAIYISLWLNS